jgi:tetratricopeptide (TPR) repeat protein
MHAEHIEAVLEQGGEHEAAGDYGAAAQCYSAVLAQHPDNPHAAYCRGHCRMLLGEFAAAAEDFTTAMRLAPEEGHPVAYRAVAMFALGNYAEAIEDCTTALQCETLPPATLARLYYTRATAYHALGKTEAAEEDFAAAGQYDLTGRLDPRSR